MARLPMQWVRKQNSLCAPKEAGTVAGTFTPRLLATLFDRISFALNGSCNVLITRDAEIGENFASIESESLCNYLGIRCAIYLGLSRGLVISRPRLVLSRSQGSSATSKTNSRQRCGFGIARVIWPKDMP